MFSFQMNLKTASSILSRVKSHNSSRFPQLSEGDTVLKIPFTDVGGLWIMKIRGTCHRVLVVKVAANLEVTCVIVEGVVVEAHLAGDHDGHLDVEGDSLGS